MKTEQRGPAAREARRRAETTAIAIARTRAGVLLQAVAAATVVALLWPTLPGPGLPFWGGVVLLASLVTLAPLRREARLDDPPRLAMWRRWLVLGAAGHGLAWGLLAPLIVAAAAPESLAPVYFVMVGVIAVAAWCTGPVGAALTGFAVAAAVPLAAGAVSFGPRLPGLETGLLLAAGAVVVLVARRLHRALDDAISLGIDNEHLTEIVNLLHAAAERREAELAAAPPPDSEGVVDADRTALEAASDGIVVTDADGTVRYLNSAAESLTGWPGAEAVGEPVSEVLVLFGEESRQPRPVPIEACVREDRPVRLERGTLLLHQGSPKEFLVLGTLVPVRGSDGKATGVAVSLQNVTELASLDRLIAFQRIHDPLTGLLNRRELENQLRQASESAAGDGRRHGLCSLGIDQFWQIHDSFGFAASDALLRQIAAELRPALRSTDYPARLRVDDFAILLRDCDLEHARIIAENLRREIAHMRFHWDSHPFEITASIGVVAVGFTDESPGELMHAANSARSVARENGRNRVHVYNPDDAALLRRRNLERWRQQVQQAVDENRFQLFVQEIAPTGAAADGVRQGEFLVRMRDDRGTLVAPETFLEAAERYNLMPAIDRWVVHNAIGAVQRRPPPLAHLGMCAINVSGQSLSDPGFLAQVVRELDGAALGPEQICFEITETAVIEHLEQAQGFIAALRGRGFRFALDDFGTGLSSFAYLKNLNVDYIKIDGSFVRGMTESATDRAMVESINQIGHVLGMQTIAEFVEDEATLALLRQMGVDFAQGSVIGLPRPVE